MGVVWCWVMPCNIEWFGHVGCQLVNSHEHCCAGMVQKLADSQIIV